MTTDVSYKQGRMVKDPQSMTPDEHLEWQHHCARQARDYLFSIDQPLVYRRQDGHTVAEYKNGRVLIVR